MIATFYLELMDLALETFIDHVAESVSLAGPGAAVRAALDIALLLEPLLKTGLTKVFTTTHSEVRIAENFGADLTAVSIVYGTNKLIPIVSTIY